MQVSITEIECMVPFRISNWSKIIESEKLKQRWGSKEKRTFSVWMLWKGEEYSWESRDEIPIATPEGP